jgi:hypothetical protein
MWNIRNPIMDARLAMWLCVALVIAGSSTISSIKEKMMGLTLTDRSGCKSVDYLWHTHAYFIAHCMYLLPSSFYCAAFQ